MNENTNGNGGNGGGDGGDDDAWGSASTPAGHDTLVSIAQAALRDCFERMRIAAINGLQMADAIRGLSPDALRACVTACERQCRDAGHNCHETARALHDLLRETKE